ncbi:MAG: proton-conducting transporter membrane subunit, partial [Candidatus Omnitrophota bacterium]
MLSAEFFRFDNLSIFVGIFVSIFSLLIILYSFGFMRGRKGLVRYYLYMLMTLAASLGAVFANNLLLFIVFWGFLGLLLYLLIGFGQKKNTAYTAKKTFIIIGGTDAFMLLGLALVWKLAGSLEMDKISIALTSKTAVAAYVCLAIGAFAKAGAMPVHTWVPDTAEDAPTPVSAFLPASLDKLLGIYFLIRLTLDMFKMDLAMNTVLMAIGSFTIVAAVMMALVQHDLKRLLGYHAVSQVGYMILGIGTGNPIGIAGGLFHMLNNAIYKSCLFLSGGAVEKKA